MRSAEELVAVVLVGGATVELWGSEGLTLKGLLGTLIPPQVTATVCLAAEVGVYEQEYTPSPLLFTFTSMGSPLAFWKVVKARHGWKEQSKYAKRLKGKKKETKEKCLMYNFNCFFDDKLTWARIFKGPFPASLASTMNSAGLLMMQPVFSRPGP